MSRPKHSSKGSGKHPALVAYEDLCQQIMDNKDDPSLMPMGSGDIVGRARFEAELDRRGIIRPEGFIAEMQWLEEIGLTKTAKRMTRKFNKRFRQ